MLVGAENRLSPISLPCQLALIYNSSDCPLLFLEPHGNEDGANLQLLYTTALLLDMMSSALEGRVLKYLPFLSFLSVVVTVLTHLGEMI